MPAPKISREEVLDRITEIFRQYGYEGASLSLISKATGLGRASLYHHFPGGKEEMGHEVFRRIGEHLDRNVLSPLRAKGSPKKCLKNWTQGLNLFYGGGSKNCLLGTMILSGGSDRFSKEITSTFRTLIDLLSSVLEEAKIPHNLARRRAARAIGEIQGALLVSRGLEDEGYFQQILEDLPGELLSVK